MCLFCHNNLRKISLKVFSPRGSEDPIRLPSGANRLNSDSSGGASAYRGFCIIAVCSGPCDECAHGRFQLMAFAIGFVRARGERTCDVAGGYRLMPIMTGIKTAEAVITASAMTIQNQGIPYDQVLQVM